MPNDKRPKPTIDMTAERKVEAARPLLSAGGAASTGERPAQKPSADQGHAATKAKRNGPGFAGYLLAGLIGGGVVAGGGYFASKMDIPGFSLTGPGTRQRIGELEERTASLESALRVLERAAPAPAYEPSVSGSEGVNELRSRLDGIVDAARGLDQTVQSLSQKVQALEQRPAAGGETRDTLEAEIAAQTAPLQQRLTSAERELETLTHAQNERIADARTASLTLALTNLKRAIADGRPFPAELAAVETLSSGKLPVSQLAPYKDTGVSSMAELQSEFAEASKKTVEAYYSEKSNSFMGEVLSRAKSVVQIKPADSTGDSVEAILGRMSASLRSGDLKTALLQGAALPHPPQEMMDWFAKAQARLAADEALRKTDQELLAALTRPPARHQ
ncbi:MAG: hypothetical protein WAM63_11110 [Rhodomicrobium sp.]